jgi:hypothetical protein
MGKGPKNPPATEASKKGSIADRLRDGEDASTEAPDPCRDPQEIAIALDSDQELSVGDRIQICPRQAALRQIFSRTDRPRGRSGGQPDRDVHRRWSQLRRSGDRRLRRLGQGHGAGELVAETPLRP